MGFFYANRESHIQTKNCVKAESGPYQDRFAKKTEDHLGSLAKAGVDDLKAGTADDACSADIDLY